MQLPELSGVEVIRRLEDNPKLGAGKHIIAMSAGWTTANKATRPVSPLVVANVPKPFDLEELLALITFTQQHSRS